MGQCPLQIAHCSSIFMLIILRLRLVIPSRFEIPGNPGTEFGLELPRLLTPRLRDFETQCRCILLLLFEYLRRFLEEFKGLVLSSSRDLCSQIKVMSLFGTRVAI